VPSFLEEVEGNECTVCHEQMVIGNDAAESEWQLGDFSRLVISEQLRRIPVPLE
jgi:hypothetical protein